MIETLFYDGDCGLCHRAVRFVLARDPQGALFRFAPLQGETFLARVTEERRAQLPDSIVVETVGGHLLVRWQAARHTFRRLGGGWAILEALMALVPRFLGDLLYDAVAGSRHRFFSRPGESCPVASPELMARFDP